VLGFLPGAKNNFISFFRREKASRPFPTKTSFGVLPLRQPKQARRRIFASEDWTHQSDIFEKSFKKRAALTAELERLFTFVFFKNLRAFANIYLPA